MPQHFFHKMTGGIFRTTKRTTSTGHAASPSPSPSRPAVAAHHTQATTTQASQGIGAAAGRIIATIRHLANQTAGGVQVQRVVLGGGGASWCNVSVRPDDGSYGIYRGGPVHGGLVRGKKLLSTKMIEVRFNTSNALFYVGVALVPAPPSRHVDSNDNDPVLYFDKDISLLTWDRRDDHLKAAKIMTFSIAKDVTRQYSGKNVVLQYVTHPVTVKDIYRAKSQHPGSAILFVHVE